MPMQSNLQDLFSDSDELLSEDNSPNSSSPDSSASYKQDTSRSKPRRNTSILIKWIEEHPFNPYPTKREKTELATTSGMTLRQLNYWFANVRMKINKVGFEVWKKKRLPSQKGNQHPQSISALNPNIIVTNELPTNRLYCIPYSSLPSFRQWPLTSPAMATPQVGVFSNITATGKLSNPPSNGSMLSMYTGPSASWYPTSQGRMFYSPPAHLQQCSCSLCSSRAIAYNPVPNSSAIFNQPSVSSDSMITSTLTPSTTLPLTSTSYNNGSGFPVFECTSEQGYTSERGESDQAAST